MTTKAQPPTPEPDDARGLKIGYPMKSVLLSQNNTLRTALARLSGGSLWTPPMSGYFEVKGLGGGFAEI
jgi:hypothetical protein